MAKKQELPIERMAGSKPRPGRRLALEIVKAFAISGIWILVTRVQYRAPSTSAASITDLEMPWIAAT